MRIHLINVWKEELYWKIINWIMIMINKNKILSMLIFLILFANQNFIISGFSVLKSFMPQGIIKKKFPSHSCVDATSWYTVPPHFHFHSQIIKINGYASKLWKIIICWWWWTNENGWKWKGRMRLYSRVIEKSGGNLALDGARERW